jgi:hypothetical protein
LHFLLDRRLLNKVPINAGFNKLIFDNLKESASKLNSPDNMCALIFDEMAIMPHIDYDKSTDKFYGFQDFGDSQNFQIADHVLVFYLPGFFRKLQQALYFGFSSSATKSSVLVDLIKLLTHEVQNCGLKIVTTICDQGQPTFYQKNRIRKEVSKLEEK